MILVGMKRYLFLWIILLYIHIQNVNAMDLNEALSTAYNTNENLKSAQQKFLIDVEDFPQALSSFLPDVSMNIKSSIQKQTNAGQSAPGVTNYGPDVARSIDVQQNLFNGGRSAYALKIAQAGFLESKAVFYNTEQQTLTDALKAYIGLCSAKEKYNIALSAVDFYTQALNMVREQMKVGEATVTDLAAAEAQVAKGHSGVSQQLANLLSAKATFKTVVGIEGSDDVIFPDAPDGLPTTMDSFHAIVEKSNFDLLAAKSKMDQSKDAVKSAQGALLPTANLSVSQGRNYYDPEQSPNNSGIRNNSRSVSAVVSVTIPILSSGGSSYSKVRQSKAQSRQAVYALDYVKKQVNANAISNWEGFVAMKDAMTSANEAIRSQTLALEGIKSEYSVGTKTILDVLQQQDQLNQIKSQAVDIQTQYLTSAYQLTALMGKMTAYNMKLKVKYFNPDVEFRNLKHKIVGF